MTVRTLATGLHLLTLADYRRMRWKNGLGLTTEIAASPADAGLNGKPFDWRVSLAGVDTDCEFSSFPGYDRTILLAEGAGMELSFDAAPPQRIEQRFVPFNFKGEWHTQCRLLAGLVRDFNVMILRTRLTCHLEIVKQPGQTLIWRAATETLLVYCFKGRALLDGVGTIPLELNEHHTLLVEKQTCASRSVPVEIFTRTADTVAALIYLRYRQ
ncbi:MAG: HutD family protein [Gammaproteobacteria bacterium]